MTPSSHNGQIMTAPDKWTKTPIYWSETEDEAPLQGPSSGFGLIPVDIKSTETLTPKTRSAPSSSRIPPADRLVSPRFRGIAHSLGRESISALSGGNALTEGNKPSYPALRSPARLCDGCHRCRGCCRDHSTAGGTYFHRYGLHPLSMGGHGTKKKSCGITPGDVFLFRVCGRKYVAKRKRSTPIDVDR